MESKVITSLLPQCPYCKMVFFEANHGAGVLTIVSHGEAVHSLIFHMPVFTEMAPLKHTVYLMTKFHPLLSPHR